MYIWYYYTIYTHTRPESYVNNVLLFFSNWSWTVPAARGNAAQRQDNKMLLQLDTHPYDIDLFDEVEDGSLLNADKRTANSLVYATVHAIKAGLVKRVGVLFTNLRSRLPPPPPCSRWTSPSSAFWRLGSSSSSSAQDQQDEDAASWRRSHPLRWHSGCNHGNQLSLHKAWGPPPVYEGQQVTGHPQ